MTGPVVVGASATHVGQIRDSNEDRALVAGVIGAVADGMGGHVGGEKAAAMAIAELSGVRGAISEQRLVEVVEAANRRIHDAALAPELRGMGTTIVAATYDDETGVMTVVNVGDSRGYLFRQGRLSQVTVDHSLVEDLYRQGRITAEEAKVHPQRNIVTRALGIGSEVEVDVFAVVVEVGDRVVLASDGLFDEVSDEGIAEILGLEPDTQRAVDALVRAAVEHGGRDNVTVVVLDVLPGDSDTLVASESAMQEPGHADDVLGAAIVNTPRPAKRRMPFRSVLLLFGVIGVLGFALSGTAYYARNGYYADGVNGEVAILRGRPGGVLWFKPAIQERTDIEVSELDGASRERLSQQTVWASLDEARQFIDNFEAAPANPDG